MSDRQNLAEFGTTLALAALGFAEGSVAAFVVPLAVLTAIGGDMWRKSDTALAQRAVARARKALDDAPGLSERGITAAFQLIKENRADLKLDPSELARRRDDLPGALLDLVIPAAQVPPDDGVPDILRLVLGAAYEELRKQGDFHKVFSQDLMLQIAAGQDVTVKALNRIEGKIDNLGTRLENIEAQSREMLNAMALRFGEPEPEAMALPALQTFLIEKAKDYRALKAEVEAIDDGLKRLSNLKAAAKGAIEAGELEQVESLLSRVQEVELEEAAKTAELRADNALLRGKVAQAFVLLTAAANSFEAVDPLEPARRRIMRYFALLRNHGLRFGGAGLCLAADLLRPILTAELHDADAWLWAAGQNSLGNALSEQGTRTGGAEGAALLGAAVAAYGEALRVGTEADHPVAWATTQNNLGTALQEQGTRTGGPEGARLLGEAVAAYRAALRVYTEADHPVDWAVTQMNLGNALQSQGTRTGGAAGAALLGQAVEAYTAALRVTTEADHPVHWAMTQNNLGAALSEQGTRTGGAAGAALLGEAVAAYRAALRVYTEADHPVQWAMTQNNLGNALQDQGTRTGGAAGAALLGQAVEAYTAALRVTTEADHPVHWATTQNNLGTALQEQGTRTGGPEGARLLGEAVAAYRAALRVYTEADHPVDRAMTQMNLGNALQSQGTRTGGPEGARLLGEAVAAYGEALRVRTEADHPVDWAMTRENLAILEGARAQHDSTADPRPHLVAALDHVAAALTVYDPEHMPYNHDKATRLRDALTRALAALDGG